MALVLALGCGDDDGTTPRDAGPGTRDTGMVGTDSGPPRDTGMGGMDSGMGGMGECTDAADMAAITRMDYQHNMMGMSNLDYGDIVTACARDCFLGGMMMEPAFSTCTRGCVDEDTMMSAQAPCRDCFVARAVCAASNCALQCIDGGKDCDMCQCDNDCVQDFDTCSGLMTSMCM
jgi:hypothetical protein